MNDALGIGAVIYIMFGLMPFLLMHTSHAAHWFGYVLIFVNLVMIEVFYRDGKRC